MALRRSHAIIGEIEVLLESARLELGKIVDAALFQPSESKARKVVQGVSVRASVAKVERHLSRRAILSVRSMVALWTIRRTNGRLELGWHTKPHGG
jgi:hypothetical protein